MLIVALQWLLCDDDDDGSDEEGRKKKKVSFVDSTEAALVEWEGKIENAAIRK